MYKTNDNLRMFNSGENLDDFSREILVVCPKCESCAFIKPINSEDMNLFAARRLICPKCAYFREWNEKTFRRCSRDNPATDGFFGEVLWLQTACENELLWAYNLNHLTFIENYVRAKLRERRRRLDSGWLPTGLSNRLPKWIGAAHNRETVLKAVQKLKEKFAVEGKC